VSATTQRIWWSGLTGLCYLGRSRHWKGSVWRAVGETKDVTDDVHQIIGQMSMREIQAIRRDYKALRAVGES